MSPFLSFSPIIILHLGQSKSLPKGLAGDKKEEEIQMRETLTRGTQETERSVGGKEWIKTSHKHNKKHDKTIKNRAKIKRLEKREK